ncbi:TPA: potassium channel protein [Candidatus Poribacteria bacterium]|nr:potassium channel protein [Candidatus Poribacteria bacterium]HEX28856.1 potassium channel protein [Candidatus Poribacteria bacterium]
MQSYRNLVITGLMILLEFFIGLVGYKLIMPDWSWLKSLYMTAITLTTVGYSDYGIFSESTSAKIFTITLIITGIGIFAFGASSLVGFVVEGHLSDVLRRRRMVREISKLKDHYIVCGAGSTGVHVIDSLSSRKVPFVVIDKNEERIKELLRVRSFLYIAGNASDDEVLHMAGIERAKALISILSDDRDNLFVTLSARTLNPKLTIVSKAVESKSIAKIRKSGADYVIIPDYLGGLKIASILIRPNVVEFLDGIRADPVYKMVEAKLPDGSPMIGKSLRETRIRSETGLTVFAIRRGKEIIYNPSPDFTLLPGDGLVVIGSKGQISKLGKITGDPELASRWFS